MCSIVFLHLARFKVEDPVFQRQYFRACVQFKCFINNLNPSTTTIRNRKTIALRDASATLSLSRGKRSRLRFPESLFAFFTTLTTSNSLRLTPSVGEDRVHHREMKTTNKNNERTQIKKLCTLKQRENLTLWKTLFVSA